MRKRGRTDQNQTVIVAALRRLGFEVLSLAPMGDGCPDLLLYRQGKLTLVEVKAPKGTMTPQQVQFRTLWPVTVLRSIEDVMQFADRRLPTGQAECSSCGVLFSPLGRNVAMGRRRYCVDCGRPAALRDAKAAYRARQRQQAARAETGVSCKTIG
jgi:hypothetical protein